MRRTVIAIAVVLTPIAAVAAESGFGLLPANASADQLAPYVRLLVSLSLLSFIPAAVIAMTSFTRIIVTLSFLRHALGMPETPPNAVLLTLALFLTWFTMAPTLEQSHNEGVAPFLAGRINSTQAIERGFAPLRTFMLAHVRDEDLVAVSELARTPLGEVRADTPLRVLVPAFMLSELRAAFVAGFIIFLPFLLIDLIVAAVLMALGMMMVPPASISLPLKVLLFVLIDGWSLLLRAIAGAYG
ncbi:flagellar biosynthetic protein FliP [Povalibacter uvarum]|uniref:Flagellar biosynthetic protein FliP n=1 Tax=Povalibacter uvarum TaxID=732238 RepID=A0A841HG20_9GAMM|nr:flagellar type III secretion system pore protein FliP [Povalibacter uvarum]MBB6091182.1 flagellar biosynthetic protein FliP [Povalibacter uvarum]